MKAAFSTLAFLAMVAYLTDYYGTVVLWIVGTVLAAAAAIGLCAAIIANLLDSDPGEHHKRPSTDDPVHFVTSRCIALENQFELAVELMRLRKRKHAFALRVITESDPA